MDSIGDLVDERVQEMKARRAEAEDGGEPGAPTDAAGGGGAGSAGAGASSADEATRRAAAQRALASVFTSMTWDAPEERADATGGDAPTPPLSAQVNSPPPPPPHR